MSNSSATPVVHIPVPPPPFEVLDATHPLAEAHQPKEGPNGFLLTRNSVHYMLGAVLLITGEVVRRYTALLFEETRYTGYALLFPEAILEGDSLISTFDSFSSLIALTLVWLMSSYFEQAYCQLSGIRSFLSMIVVELGFQVVLVACWCSLIFSNGMNWLVFLGDIGTSAAYLSIAVIFLIPMTLAFGAILLILLLCAGGRRSEGGSYLTLGVEDFVRSTKRIELDDEEVWIGDETEEAQQTDDIEVAEKDVLLRAA